MLDHYLLIVSAYLSAHPYWGPLFAFIVAFTESLPIIGTIVPGSITMSVIGILIGRGLLSFLLTTSWTTVGALLGDIIGFAIGKYCNENLRKMWPFSKYPKWIAMGESFFKAHGGKSIIIGRFVGPARSTIPLIAGLVRMHWIPFLFSAIPSALLWSLFYLSPGILIGAISMELPHKVAVQFVGIALGALLFIWIIAWLIRHFFTILYGLFRRMIHVLWQHIQHDRYLHPLFFILRNPRHFKDSSQLSLFLIASLCFAAFLGILISLYLQVGIMYLNMPIYSLTQTSRLHIIDNIFVVITNAGSPLLLLLLTLIMGAGLSLQKRFYEAFHFVGGMFFIAGSVWFFKHIAYFPRPPGIMLIDPDSSFPSGHSALSVVFYGLFALFWSKSHRTQPTLGYVSLTILVTLIMFSRIYLAAHWFSDVIAGFLLGCTVLVLTNLSLRRRFIQKTATAFPPIQCLYILLAMGVTFLTTEVLCFSKTQYHYTPFYPIHHLSIEKWWKRPLAYLPIARTNRLGQPTQPFNVQWAGNIDEIRTTLVKQGWHVIFYPNTQTTLERDLYFVKDDNAIMYRPHGLLSFLDRLLGLQTQNPVHLFPLLYNNQAPIMLIWLDGKRFTLELRFWATPVAFTDSTQQLYLAAINYHPKADPNPFALTLTSNIIVSEWAGVHELLPFVQPFEYKVIKVPESAIPPELLNEDWDGTLLMIREKPVKLKKLSNKDSLRSNTAWKGSAPLPS